MENRSARNTSFANVRQCTLEILGTSLAVMHRHDDDKGLVMSSCAGYVHRSPPCSCPSPFPWRGPKTENQCKEPSNNSTFVQPREDNPSLLDSLIEFVGRSTGSVELTSSQWRFLGSCPPCSYPRHTQTPRQDTPMEISRRANLKESLGRKAWRHQSDSVGRQCPQVATANGNPPLALKKIADADRPTPSLTLRKRLAAW